MKTSASSRIAAICFAVVFPTLVTWVYFQFLADSAGKLQQVAYGLGKALQFAFPLFWVGIVLRQKVWRTGLPEDTKPSLSPAKSIAFGLLFGLLVVLAMFAIYRYLFNDSVVRTLGDEVVTRVRGFSVDSWQKYALLGLFYALAHSFLEEYYFRWFVFGQLRQFMALGAAAVIAGLAFMSHHVIVLAAYFGWFSAETILLSLSIAIGGAVWAWQFDRSRSLLGPWVSHLLVDAGIFLIGFDMVKESLT